VNRSRIALRDGRCASSWTQLARHARELQIRLEGA
jgi:hypothetical protein